ncbi:MAG: hypothetical protein KGL39_54290 [Patescibacteria group bacterium]|nr:hypothetical protein [Patescibacteria group bacterium]
MNPSQRTACIGRFKAAVVAAHGKQGPSKLWARIGTGSPPRWKIPACEAHPFPVPQSALGQGRVGPSIWDRFTQAGKTAGFCVITEPDPSRPSRSRTITEPGTASFPPGTALFLQAVR